MRCSTGCPRVAARHSLPPAGGVVVLTAGIRAVGCASASNLGSRRARMRRWRRLTVPGARAAPRPCPWLLGFAAASASASQRLPRLLLPSPRRFVASFARAQRVHASAPLRRLCGEMFRLHVPARAAFRTRTPAGGRGLVVVVLRGLRQQCRLGFSCLCPEPGYLQFSSSSTTTACASDTVADLKLWAVARRRTKLLELTLSVTSD